MASSDDDRNGKHVIRLYDFVRGTSTRLSNGSSDVYPVFSPDAKSIAYTHNNAIFVVPTTVLENLSSLMVAGDPW